MMKCVVGDCQDQIEKDIWVEELGFCVEHSHAYYNDELDYVTLERISQWLKNVGGVKNKPQWFYVIAVSVWTNQKTAEALIVPNVNKRYRKD